MISVKTSKWIHLQASDHKWTIIADKNETPITHLKNLKKKDILEMKDSSKC